MGKSFSFSTISYVVISLQSTILCLSWKPFHHSEMWSPGSSWVHLILWSYHHLWHWPLIPAFPGPNCRPNTVCPSDGLYSHGVPCGAGPPFVTQTGDQGLTWTSTQTLSNMG